MNIIPVIDLKDGHVVTAQQGQRENYKPIKTGLCKSSAIKDIVDFYLHIHSFKKIYIADLNEITGKGSNEDQIFSTIKQYSTIEFWVDSGKKIKDLPPDIHDIKYKPIIGSESQEKTNIDKVLNNCILSLDFSPASQFIGPSQLLNTPEIWPKNIIIMTLNKVGSNSGPDFNKLNYFHQKYPDHNFIAAGGIRHQEDLLNLKKMGINNALVASALHSGVINRKTIKKLISAP